VVKRVINEETLLSLLALLMSGVAPNIFPAAQAGIAKMSILGERMLIPSIIILGVIAVAAFFREHRRLANRLFAGAVAGFIATAGLEIVRTASFRFGGMPGDMPRLLGVLLMDRFMLGPSSLSDLLGYAYHFWNGICFGIIFAVLLGRKQVLWAVVYAELIGVGFLLSPAVKALGIGFMGSQMPSMPATVVLAHLVFGLILGVLGCKWIRDEGWLFSPLR
jgi:hypothetical protein